MSKIKDNVNQYGVGPFEQQQVGTVEGVNRQFQYGIEKNNGNDVLVV